MSFAEIEPKLQLGLINRSAKIRDARDLTPASRIFAGAEIEGDLQALETGAEQRFHPTRLMPTENKEGGLSTLECTLGVCGS